MFLHLKWKDTRILQGDTVAKKLFHGENGRPYIDLDKLFIDKVWVPDIFFPNEKKSYVHDVMIKNQMMRLFPDGTFLYITR